MGRGDNRRSLKMIRAKSRRKKKERIKRQVTAGKSKKK